MRDRLGRDTSLADQNGVERRKSIITGRDEGRDQIYARFLKVDGADDRVIQFCRQRRQVVEMTHKTRRAGVA